MCSIVKILENFHFAIVKPAKFNKIIKDKDRTEFLLKVNFVRVQVGQTKNI